MDGQRRAGRIGLKPPTTALPDVKPIDLSTLIARVVRGLESGSREWTLARRKDSLHRVLSGSRSDEERLRQRLSQLISSWEAHGPDTAADPDSELDALPQLPASSAAAQAQAGESTHASAHASAHSTAHASADWVPTADYRRVVGRLGSTASNALPADDPAHTAVAHALVELSSQLAEAGPTPVLADALDRVSDRADRLLRRRHEMVEQLKQLCGEMTAGIVELAEDDGWAQGQALAMKSRLEEGMSARGVRSVARLLSETRTRQHELRAERTHARDLLKTLIQSLLHDLGELGTETGRFTGNLDGYAAVIEKADSLESLAGVVRELVQESRGVASLVQHTRDHLLAEHAKASKLDQKVHGLEAELVRLSNEVSTDQLTQVANRRGLLQAFEIECGRAERLGTALSIALIDVDDFKRLNDKLGHGVGDRALKALAGAVKNALRPTDFVARYGGEEFVVLLPGSAADEAEQVLTRLQRSLTSSLFMHESNPVFVTFSAGVTGYVVGERIEESLDRADEALYEAKRSGKNRTCIA
ncbi:MAG: hypothetical protein JWP52_2158 [Rhizobacter sp.]|nr:hypothetical protein [Rhizobacter sp.]